MVKKFKTFDPQLVVVEQHQGSAVSLTNAAKLSLYKKSQKSGIGINILEEVYHRGYSIWKESFGDSPEQFAFDRVNSFIAGGFAASHLDGDLIKEESDDINIPKDDSNTLTLADPYHKKDPNANHRKEFQKEHMKRIKDKLKEKGIEEANLSEKRGLWDNIHAKRERIKHGSGEHMRKPGSKGAPTAQALKQSQTEEAYTGSEEKSTDFTKPNSRFVGTTELTNTYKSMTPGYSLKDTVKKVVKEHRELAECNGNCTCGKEPPIKEDAKGYKNPTGGLTQKGRDHYNRTTGSHLKAPVTTPPSELKAGSKAANRRKSFCARMGGVKGPMRDEHGKPTRKALALRKWNC